MSTGAPATGGADGGADPTAGAPEEPSLDVLLQSLEAALHRLADPAAPLEQAVADYQQARGLLARAEARLEAARRRAAVLDLRPD